MPKDNIERAIARGAGADANSEAYDSVTYEGYGASGAALIVEALTDNRNRTAADVRFAFSKFGGSLGTPGSVAWMFERKGVITTPAEAVDEDTITMAAAEGGAEDVREDGDMWVITCEPHDLGALRSALEAAEIPIESADLSLLPKTQVEVDADQARTLLRLVDALEESDDVQDVYFNFDIPDAVLADAGEPLRGRVRASAALGSRSARAATAAWGTRPRRRRGARRSRGCAARTRRR